MSTDNIELMPDTLSEELESFLAVDGLLDRNPSITSAIPVLAEEHAELKVNLAKAPAEAIRRQSLKTSVKGAKVLSRKEIANAAYVVNSALRVIGRRKNIEQLKTLPLYTEKKLARMRFIQLGQLCKGLYDLMNANKLSLADIGVDDEQITTFNTAVEQYNEAIKNADISRGLGEASTEEIMGIFKDLERTMDDIFETVNSLKNKYPTFYTEFMQVSEIREYGNRHRKTVEPPVTPPADPLPQ